MAQTGGSGGESQPPPPKGEVLKMEQNSVAKLPYQRQNMNFSSMMTSNGFFQCSDVVLLSQEGFGMKL
jgi:hypothetical protein